MAAWLGWLFDGLDMHLYTLVAAPFVASLLAVSDPGDPRVKQYSALIQGGVLAGLGAGRRLLRTAGRSAGTEPGAVADDPDLRAFYRAFVGRA